MIVGMSGFLGGFKAFGARLPRTRAVADLWARWVRQGIYRGSWEMSGQSMWMSLSKDECRSETTGNSLKSWQILLLSMLSAMMIMLTVTSCIGKIERPGVESSIAGVFAPSRRFSGVGAWRGLIRSLLRSEMIDSGVARSKRRDCGRCWCW